LHKKIGAHKSDSLSWLLKHPAHADPAKVKAVDIDKVEEEMWYP